MTETKWACPQCQAGASVERSPAHLSVECSQCGFIFPRPAEGRDGTHWKEMLALAETSTDKWADIGTDRYAIIRLLGSGAQGRILLAHHRHLDQLCVIKVLNVPEDEWKDIAIARLRSEARAGAAVNHPNVARVLDCDCVKGTWYFVMEYVDGVNLRKMLNEADHLRWEQVLDLGIQVAQGLSAIHQAGLIHRDIKPSNLMLRSNGQVKIMDLGLVKIRGAGQGPGVTHEGQLLGTPYYMSPEQFEAEGSLDHRADVYALGATLYHLAVGRPPHQGVGVLDLAKKHRHDPVIWPEELQADLPAWFRQIVDACLAKKADHRYESAVAVAEALRAGWEEGASTVLVPAPSPRAPPRGVTVTAFNNLTQREADDWVGDAIADYVTSRLMALRDVHIADRHSLRKTLQQIAGREGGGTELEQILEAGRLVGAGTIVMGSYQIIGEKLRITVHALSGGRPEPQHVTHVAGRLDDLFALEDQIATAVVGLVSAELAPAGRPGGTTENLEATEKLTRAKRAFAEGNYHEAIRLAEEAAKADAEYLDPISVIGVCYARCGEYDRAAEYHQREEYLARTLNNQPRLAEAFGNLGVMYYFQGEYALAHEFLDKASAIATELNLLGDAAKYYGNLGFVLMRLNRHAEAEHAFARTIEISKQFGDLVSLVEPYNGMGGVLLKQERFCEAEEYYQRALVLAREVGDRVNIGISHMNLGRCACLTGHFDEAQVRFDEALKTFEATDFWNGRALTHEHLAEMHLLTGRVEAALTCIDQRIELARRHRNNRMEAEAWEQKAKAYEANGQSDEALRCLKHSVEVAQRPPPFESLHRYLEEVSKRPPFRN
jgi:tetratricopeptide (TPR) repeat protein/tRNA A-37 threonylcarbamoyl transferase component Bud32/TolB-like protein